MIPIIFDMGKKLDKRKNLESMSMQQPNIITSKVRVRIINMTIVVGVYNLLKILISVISNSLNLG